MQENIIVGWIPDDRILIEYANQGFNFKTEPVLRTLKTLAYFYYKRSRSAGVYFGKGLEDRHCL